MISSASAQITTDGSTNTTLTPTDNGIRIDEGSRAGGNLFHSFGEFSVLNGSEAFFNNASDVVNIFSRVTGGKMSNIDGLIRANGRANLFLINPGGILFGENASLNIGGSFYGSTADSILFPDGIEFSATSIQRPILTINAPIGLNLRDNPGKIVNRSVVENKTGDVVGLEVALGSTLSLVGGNINVESGQATANGGNIELGGLRNAGTVTLNSDGSLGFPEDVARADITLSNAADIDVRGTVSGSITINARNVNLSAGDLGKSQIRAGIIADSTSPKVQGGDITINATDNVNIYQSFIVNNVEPNAVGIAGDITINTNDLSLTNGVFVSSDNLNQGESGDVIIKANSVRLKNGLIAASTTSGIETGSIFLQIAETLTLQQDSLINAKAVENANGGNIDINAKSIIAFPSSGNGNDIIASADQGQGGNINITAEVILGIEQRPATPGNGTNDIDASSEFGLALNVLDTNRFQETGELSSNVVSAESVSEEACAAGQSGLILKGKGGVPPAPNLPLSSQLLLVDGKTITPNFSQLNNQQQITQNNRFKVQPIKTSQGDIYPARGVIVKEDGTLILTPYPTNHIATRTTENAVNCNQTIQ